MAGLDDWPDIRRTIDDAMDEGELLPNVTNATQKTLDYA